MQPASSIHWNAYPSAIAAACMAGGIVIADGVDANLYLWAFIGCAVGGLSLSALRGGRLIGTDRGLLLLCTFGSVTLLGATRYADSVRPGAHEVATLPPGTTLELFGRPVDAARTRSGVRFILEVDSIRTLDPTYSATASRRKGRVQVYLRHAFLSDVDPCRGMAVAGRLEELPEPRNPGEFDYAAFLRGRHVFSRVWADSARTAAAPAGRFFDPACLAHEIRSRVEAHFERSVEDPAARAVILALLVGDRSGIDDETEHRFRRAGLLHLLAVSGLHVLIVGMILHHLLRPLLLRCRCSWRAAEWARTFITGSVLMLYALVTGLPASVVRAVVMAVLLMTGTLLQRRAHSLNTLGVAVVALLFARPAQLFEPGFQLSVGAVAAIVTLVDRFEDALPSKESSGFFLRSIRSSVSVSLAASAGTLPVLLYHFGSVSFAGLILNIVAVPLTSLTLASSVTTAGAAGLSDGVGDTLAYTAQFSANLLLQVVERGEPYLRWAYVEWYVDDPAIIASLVFALIAVAQWPRPRLRWRLLALSVICLCAAPASDLARGKWTSRLSAVFLDVGQGDAALIRFPNGKTMLIDAGPRTQYSDAGRFTILPHLHRQGIRSIDAIVITHPDSDHLGGLPSILRAVKVGRVFHSGFEHTSDLYGETSRLLDSLRVPYTAVRSGDTLNLDPSTRIHILYPDRARVAQKPNASSVVINVRYGSTSFLMMGDAEEEAEREILRHFAPMLAASVVKVGHHGSSTSSTPLFASRIGRDGQLAVISVGRHNRYGLPDSSVIRRWVRAGAHIRRTDVSGAIWLESNGRSVIERRWR